jgi:hypothetical protein
MRSVIAIPAAFLLVACQESSPVQPVMPSLLTVAPATVTSSTSGSVKLVPYVGRDDWVAVGIDFAECGGHNTYATSQAGSGTATHFGRFTMAYTVCWKPDGSFVFSRGALTAANGDNVRFLASPAMGSAWVLNPDFTFALTNSHFVGGTGRFTNATGTYSCAGTSNSTLTAGTLNCEGTISSVGSGK